MFCNQCGTQTPDNYKFCPACGTLLLSKIEPDEITERNDIQTQKIEQTPTPLSSDVLNEKRNTWTYECSYIQGHIQYKKEMRGNLAFHRKRKQSNIVFSSNDNSIQIVIPITSIIDVERVMLEHGFIKKMHEMVRIRYVDEHKKTLSPVFKINEKEIEGFFRHYKRFQDELVEPVIHSVKTRGGVNSVLIDVMSPLMHHNEGILWEQNEAVTKSQKKYDIWKTVTNYRVYVYDNLDDLMLSSSFLSDIDDVVVVNRHVRSKSEGTSYIVGGYGKHTFAGVMPSHSSSDSNAVGDMVFMRHGKTYLVIEEVPDPDGVATMIKSVMSELYPRSSST